MEILSLSFGEEVRQALSYANMTLPAWNKKGLWVQYIYIYMYKILLRPIKDVYQNEWGQASKWSPSSKNLTVDFYRNRPQLVIPLGCFTIPNALVWCDPHSAAPRWWEKEMYRYNGQIRWGGFQHSSSCNAHVEKDLSPVLVHHTPSTAGSRTRHGCTCASSLSSIKQWNGWGENKFQ